MSRLKEAYSTCMECGGKMKMKSGGNWIKNAIRKPGSFTKQAQAAGMSVSAFRNKVLANKGDYSPTTVRRANLAKTLSKMRKGENGMDVNGDPKKLAPLSSAAQEIVSAANRGTAPLPDLSGRSQVVEDLGLRRKPAPGLARGGSEKVAAYQKMLRDKGFKVSVDGAWGKETQAAYEQFMKSNSRKPDMRPSRADLPENRNYYSKVKSLPTSTGKGWYTPEQWDQATARNNATENGLPSVSLPTSKGIIRTSPTNNTKKSTMGPEPYTRKYNTSPSPSYNFYSDKPDAADSAMYKRAFESMLKGDPSAVGEYNRINQVNPMSMSSKGLKLYNDRRNAYEDALKQKRKMAMGGAIPGINGSVIGPAVNTAKSGQSFPRKNAGTRRSLKSYRK